ncbi:hypothetical protein H6F90_12315 [Trichocoleus sp. FACHB-591]|nr:hypothetical protein [Trichocoleus sp. FACHB-591]MBD2095932.1 hypothetical protein [Trichocoleus sp. FACHB-591]
MFCVKPLTAKFNEKDIQQIKALADVQQLKPSTLIRKAVRQFIEQNASAA